MSKHGWVIENSGKYVNKHEDYDGKYARVLNRACVYLTRWKARLYRLHSLGEVVRKVRLDKRGNAVEIIPGR